MPRKSDTNKKKSQKVPWILIGFGIGLCISVLSWFGISGLLSIIEKSKLPEEELAIFTSLFYGIVFFIALGSLRAESRGYKLLISRKPFGDLPPPVSGAKAALNRVKTFLWRVFSLFSLGWLTPALVIYWAHFKHPRWTVATCACLSSLLAGSVYAVKKKDKMKTPHNGLIFFFGIIFGAALVAGMII